MSTTDNQVSTEGAQTGDNSQKNDNNTPALRATSMVLSGAEKYANGKIHIGIAVYVSSDDKPSTLMIPDVFGVKDGEPVYITKPIKIWGNKLGAFFKKKGIKLDNKVMKLIGGTSISCEAFYYSRKDPDKKKDETETQKETVENKEKNNKEKTKEVPELIFLTMFAVTFTDGDGGKSGLIKNLTGDEALGALFDVQGASIRVLQCPGTRFDVLEKYVAELSE